MSGLSDTLPTMEDSDKTCRVCRSGEEPGSPLYKPCKCSGSISWIHQDCLESWLSVSRAQKCELCKHPFKWDKVYASQAPTRLPATIIVRHLFRTLLTVVQYVFRSLFVAFIWLAFLPYSILWVWRGLFHLARGWGVSWTAALQEVEWRKIGLAGIFMPHESHNTNATVSAATKAAAALKASESVGAGSEDGAVMTLSRMINGTIVSTSIKPKMVALEDAIVDLFKAWKRPEHQAAIQQTIQNGTARATTSKSGGLVSWLPRSALLDRMYVAAGTSVNAKWTQHKGLVYSMAEDAFSGQIIVCCVIIAFIAAFLLREWIMANQPHAHIGGDQPGGALQPIEAADQAQRNQALREALDRIQVAREAHMAEPGEDDPPQLTWVDDLRHRLEQENLENNERRQTGPGENLLIGGAAQNEDDEDEDDEGLPFGHRPATPHYRSGSATAANGEEGSNSALRRRAWSAERDLEIRDQAASASASYLPGLQAEASTSRKRQSSEDPSSGSTSPLTPLSASPASSPRLEPHRDSDDYGVESASDGETEIDDDPVAPPVLGLLPAPNAARRGGHAHDIGNDSDTEDEDEAMFGPALGPIGPPPLDDPILFDGDENPDDLFFEADLQGIMEAVGIHGPILALLQNVALVSLLISCLLVCAIWIPLMLGKTIAATNAQKIVLLPLNFVRLFTDPLADRLVNLTTKRTEVDQFPTTKARLLGFISKFGLPSKPKETAYQHLSSQIAIHVTSLQEGVVGFFADGINAVQGQWYRMAVGDTNIDRALCIGLGYFVIVAGAGCYLQYTQNRPAREAGAAIRDHIKHNFTMVKAAMFFFVEIVIFPAMCGFLLNISTLPLIPGATLSTRISHYYTSPVSSIFLTWLAGTNFMFSFAQVISIVRKCIRKGVLYFIRDPSDPDANPLREILETPAINQAKKISRSLLVYGAIILTCFGFFPWLSRLVPLGIFPLRWDMTRPLSSVPWDLVYLLAVLPFTLGRARPKRAIRNLVRQWCKITAHQLRLSSFMLGKRIADEEGTHVRRTWRAWLLLKKAPVPPTTSTHKKDDTVAAYRHEKTQDMMSSRADVVFRKDGGFARTVASDSVKIVPRKMFVRVNSDGTPLTPEGAEAIQAQLKGPSRNDENGTTPGGNDESKFTIVYVPPHFRARILLFIYLLWLTASVAIFIAVCTPLIVGRGLLDFLFEEPLHDTYSLLVGIHALMLFKSSYSFLQRQSTIYSRYKRSLSVYSLGASPASTILSVLSKHGFNIFLLAINGGVLLPLLVGTNAHLYVMLPFEMMGGGEGRRLVRFSLCLDWCYGVTIVHLACQVSYLMRDNWLVRLLREVKNQGIIKSLPLINKRVSLINRFLTLAILMPLGVTFLHRLFIYSIWKYILRSSTAAPISSFGQAYVFRLSLLTVSITTLAMICKKPVRKIAKKWMENVWESEFVIRRKLRNIDQVDGNSTNSENGNVDAAQTDDGEFMRGLNEIMDANEHDGEDGNGRRQAGMMPEVDIID